MHAIFLLALLLISQQTGAISHTIPIDAEHSLVVIGGRLTSDPAMGEYGANLIYVNSGEPLTGHPDDAVPQGQYPVDRHVKWTLFPA